MRTEGSKGVLRMTDELRETWAAAQKAETVLATTGVRRRPKGAPGLREGLEMLAALGPLVSRAVCGFDSRETRTADYLVRYPFSSSEAIDRRCEERVVQGETRPVGRRRPRRWE